jgi:hypothetical protein
MMNVPCQCRHLFQKHISGGLNEGEADQSPDS